MHCCALLPSAPLPPISSPQYDPAPAQEWDAFVAALKRPLPITFRINGQGKFADRLVERLESNFMQQFTEEPVVVSWRWWGRE